MTTTAQLPHHISTVRWLPFTEEAEAFVVGTWGEKTCQVQWWKRERSTKQSHSFTEDIYNFNERCSTNTRNTLRKMASLNHGPAYVNDIAIRQSQNGSRFALYTAGSDGHVRCIGFDSGSGEGEQGGGLSSVSLGEGGEGEAKGSTHGTFHKGSVTKIALSSATLSQGASVGDDGRIVWFELPEDGASAVQVHSTQADHAALYAAHWYDNNMLLTAGLESQLTLWDSRGKDLQATRFPSDLQTSTRTRIQCISTCRDSNSSEDKRIIATGDSEGVLALWDIRQSSKPLREHNMSTTTGVCGIKNICLYTRRQRKKGFVCAGNSLFSVDWEDSDLGLLQQQPGCRQVYNDFLSVNSVDVHGDMAVWGSDSGMLGVASAL
eukprot:CFRG6808T1